MDAATMTFHDVARWATIVTMAVFALMAFTAFMKMAKATETIARVMEASHQAELIGMKQLWQAGLTASETYQVANELRRQREEREARPAGTGAIHMSNVRVVESAGMLSKNCDVHTEQPDGTWIMRRYRNGAVIHEEIVSGPSSPPDNDTAPHSG